MASTRAKVAADRRARIEEMRRAQKARERRLALLIGGVATVLVAVVVVLIVVTAVHRHSPEGQQVLPAPVGTGAATVEPPATQVPNPTKVQGVVAYDTTGHGGSAVSATNDGKGLPFNHVDGPVTYSVTPPVGGDHNGIWANCGVYDAPVTTERAVHDMEHGAVWITYEPTLPSAQVKQLRDFVDRQSVVTETIQGQKVPTHERFMDLSPWKDASIGSPIVASAWGFQLKLTSPTDPRLQQFVDAVRANPAYTPEYGSACGGQPVDVGGQPISGA